MHELHKITGRIAQSNTNYKLRVVRKRLKKTNIGDFVMVRIRSEWFPPEIVKKVARA